MKHTISFLCVSLLILACSEDISEESKSESRYRFKTGAYVEAARNETFSICPPQKTEGTWVSEHSVALNAENCISIQAPDIAGSFDVLFLENSGLTDSVQVLVDQSYIQMGDYSHKVYVVDTAQINADERQAKMNGRPPTIYAIGPGNYENKSYKQPLIVDKTKLTEGDIWYYSNKIDTNITYSKEEKYRDSRLPFVTPFNYARNYIWRFANARSKKEGLDAVYYINVRGDVVLDTSASGYRVLSNDEWAFLMRAGSPTDYYWGDEYNYAKKEDSLKISRYEWIRPGKLKPVAQLLPNAFGLYDMAGIALEICNLSPESFFMCGLGPQDRVGGIVDKKYKGFRLLRKTPKLQKLEKF